MLSQFFESPVRIEAILGSPWATNIENFATYLFRSGYAETSARRHIRSAEHIAFWANRRGLPIKELDDAALERFGDHLPRCRCGRFSRVRPVEIIAGARLFLRNSNGADEPAIRVAQSTDVEPPILKSFGEWMRMQRGTSDLTLYNYSLTIRALFNRFGEDPSQLDAHRLRQFVLIQSGEKGWAAAKRTTTALRMYLRFLITDGRCREGLLDAIPVLAHWRLASLPRYLASEDVERIIDSCDLSSPIGKRDRAILLLLARLGLRAGDIVQLRLQDIDWKGAWIRVSGKSRRETRLPLSQEVGEAIVAYLQEGRPQARFDALFLRSRAPFRAFASHAAVSVLVASAIRRAGIKRLVRGAAHLLRHSVATSMLQHGASLQEISALLRHQSIETTQIYAKVDVRKLEQIAQPWPEVKSC
jgi:site-specific recombinase XerD